MPIALTEGQQPATESPRPVSSKRPRLPIVQFGTAEVGLDVFYVLADAVGAAQDNPKDEFYDARSIALTRTEGRSPGLEALGEGQPAELQRRLMAELRRAAAALEELEAAGVAALLDWLDAAPDPEHAMHALGLADVDYGPELVPELPRCRKCNAIQKLFGASNCCR